MKKLLLCLVFAFCPFALAQTNCPSFFPVDTFINMNGTTVGTAVTDANLTTGTEGASSGWAAATASGQTFAASQIALPANVTVNGGSTHACGFATQSLAMNADVSGVTSQLGFPSNPQNVVFSGFIANLPPYNSGSGSFYDLIIGSGALHSYSNTLHLDNGPGGPCGAYGFEIESSGGTTARSNCVTGVSAGQTIYYSFHINWTSTGTCGTVLHVPINGGSNNPIAGPAAAPCAEANIYSVSGGKIGAQIGYTMAISIPVAAGPDELGEMYLGNNETATCGSPTCGNFYFQDTMVDYTNHVFPNIPEYWAGILSPSRATDWTQAGVPGGVPSASWTQSGSTIAAGSGDRTSTIQTAMNSCGTNHYVLLGAGTFLIDGTLSIPSNCVLRGSGANQTILNQGNAGGDVVDIGSGTPSASSAINVTSGAQQWSNALTLASTSGVSVGRLLLITELNNPNYMDLCGQPGGDCPTYAYIATGWPSVGSDSARMRGETHEITGVSGSIVSITPPLNSSYNGTLPNWAALTYYGAYAHITNGGHYYEQTTVPGSSPYHCESGSSTPAFSTSGGSVTDGGCTWKDMGSGTGTQPQVVVYSPAAQNAGIENLQIYDNNLSDNINDISLLECLSCWVKGVEVNYSAAYYVYVANSLNVEVRDSYFSGSYSTGSGNSDTSIFLDRATSGTLVENNIVDRSFPGVELLEEGATGNVSAYNYVTGSLWSGLNFVMQAYQFHKAHPQMNMTEGNLWSFENNDSVHGSSGPNTSFRNWNIGTNLLCSPQTRSGRQAVTCSPTGYPGQSGVNSWYAFQVANSLNVTWNTRQFNAVGDVLGSTQAQALTNTSDSALGQFPTIQWSSGQGPIDYGGQYYGSMFGLANSDDCDPTCFILDNTTAWSTSLYHGIYNNVDGSLTWASGVTHTLPISFFLSAKPSWWTSSIPWPPIGPDVTGGGGPGGHVYSTTASNPAQYCYTHVMGGVDGGAGSPLSFNAATCYSGVVPAAATQLTGSVVLTGTAKVQ